MKIILPRKVLIFSTVILFVNIGFVSGLTSSDVLILDTGNNLGDTLYVGGNDPSSYSTIQSAIDAAKSGDTIFVYDDLSPYYENLAIGKSINLLGENKYTTIINGGGLADVVYLTIDHININGFSIQNSGNNVGISINSDYNKISDNIFNGHKYGIRLDYSHKNIVSGNTIMNNNNYGIYLYDSSDNNIHENTITDSPICIQLGHSSINNTIYGNDIVSNDIGINIEDSSYNNVYWNIIQDGQYGIYSIDSSNNFIYDDNIITNNQFGIYFHHSSQSSVYGGNTIVNNENYGIYLYDSSSINIHENNCLIIKGLSKQYL